MIAMTHGACLGLGPCASKSIMMSSSSATVSSGAVAATAKAAVLQCQPSSGTVCSCVVGAMSVAAGAPAGHCCCNHSLWHVHIGKLHI
jgi:hypothetical protein